MLAWQSVNKITDVYHTENKGPHFYPSYLDLIQKKVKKKAKRQLKNKLFVCFS